MAVRGPEAWEDTFKRDVANKSLYVLQETRKDLDMQLVSVSRDSLKSPLSERAAFRNALNRIEREKRIVLEEILTRTARILNFKRR